MAKYLLTGIDDEQWRIFKAGCDMQGITIKEAFLDYIDISISTIKKMPQYSKIEHLIKKDGGKKK